jgi:hypothetical protein
MCVCQHMFETRMKLCHTSEAHQCQLVDFTEPLQKMGYVVICHLGYYSYLNKQTVCDD